jgi:hypothetical protein
MNALNRTIPCALVFLAFATVSTTVLGQDRSAGSEVQGKWYGDDGRTYTFAGSSENTVTLKIEGQEARAKPSVSPSMDEGVVMVMFGPERILSSKYTGSASASHFEMSKPLDTVEEYQPRAVPPPVLQEIFRNHPNFSSRIDIKIVDKARLEITRHVTSVSIRSEKLRDLNEKAGIETAILTRTKQAKRENNPGEGQNQPGDARKKPDGIVSADGSQDNNKEDKPDAFVCFSDGRYVKVSEGAPCAKSARKQLAYLDRAIRALRNLIAKHSDPDSEAVKSAKAEVSRHRKEKAQLLEALDGETAVLHEAKTESATAIDLTRTTSTEIGGGGLREETRDENGLVELVREYDNDGSVSFEKSVKQKYRNGRPAQVWEAYYYPEKAALQAEIKINYYDLDGSRLYKTNMILWRNRPDQYKYWVWDKSRKDWKPTDKPPVGF